MSVFRRKEAGLRAEAQVICANADLAVVVTTAPRLPGDEPALEDASHELDEFSVRRVERYLATLDPGIQPVVVLNKCDLVPDPQAVRSYVASELPGATVIALSARTGYGVEILAGIIEPKQTAVLAGSSGCGKSTLIARLTGENLRTNAVRAGDGRGRHTTTARQMYRLPDGGVIVDTPGMREVQLWADEETGTGQVFDAFPEIAELEGACRYRDCRHEHEPGCAVKEAVESGQILRDRYESYLRLRDEAEMTREMRRRRQQEWGKQISKLAREIKKMRHS
jgi:ribosome biogenesis GTPase